MPILVIAKAKTVRMNFLAHYLLRSRIFNRRIWNLESQISYSSLLFLLLLSAQRAAQLRSRFTHLLLALRFRLRLCGLRLRTPGRFLFRTSAFGPRRRRCSAPLGPGARGGRSGFSLGLFARLIAGDQNRHVTKMAPLAIRAALWSGAHAPPIFCRTAIDISSFQPKLVGID